MITLSTTVAIWNICRKHHLKDTAEQNYSKKSGEMHNRADRKNKGPLRF